MDQTDVSGAPGVSPEPASLSWVSHPVRSAARGNKNLVLLGVLGLAGLGVLSFTASLGWALVAVALLMLGVHDYLLPTTYRLGPERVEAASLVFTRRKPWAALRSFHVGRDGVLLSPFPGRSRLEAYRGLWVRFDGDAQRREAVLELLRARITPRELA